MMDSFKSYMHESAEFSGGPPIGSARKRKPAKAKQPKGYRGTYKLNEPVPSDQNVSAYHRLGIEEPYVEPVDASTNIARIVQTEKQTGKPWLHYLLSGLDDQRVGLASKETPGNQRWEYLKQGKYWGHQMDTLLGLLRSDVGTMGQEQLRRLVTAFPIDAKEPTVITPEIFKGMTGRLFKKFDQDKMRRQLPEPADNPIWLSKDAKGRPQGYLASTGDAPKHSYGRLPSMETHMRTFDEFMRLKNEATPTQADPLDDENTPQRRASSEANRKAKEAIGSGDLEASRKHSEEWKRLNPGYKKTKAYNTKPFTRE